MPSALFDPPPKKTDLRNMSLPEIAEEFDNFARTVTPEEAEKRVKAMVAEGVIGKKKFAELRTLANTLAGFLIKKRR